MGVFKLVSRFLLFFIVFILIFIFHIKNLVASDIISPWTETTSLPYLNSNHTAFTVNDKIYVVDGSAVLGGSHDEILQSTIQPDGSISNWSTISHLPKKLIWHSSVNNNNYVFVLGGFLDSIDGISANIDNVYSSKINSDSSLDPWQSVTPLPQTLSIGAATLIGDKIYYAGGVADAHHMYETAQDVIYVATINSSNGTIGNWAIAGHLAYPNFGMKIVNIGNYLFEIGGFGTESGWHTRRALVNSDGTIGSWEESTNLPTHYAMFGLTKIDNYLLIVGGEAGGQTNKTLYSTINPDNTISEWSEVASTSFLPDYISNNSVVASGNNIYSIGGYSGYNSYINSVYMTQFNGIQPSPSPSPSPSPIPTQTPSPSPSPTPSTPPIKKVFFAPGLGGSWNLDAIINCKTNNYSGSWQLAPFAKTIYQPFFDAINSTNWKLNTFYYDWRADVRNNGNLLKNFINSNTSSNEKVNFVGHSMGGLVGRSYIESNSGGKLNSYLSVGTPHKGSAYSYPTVSAEQIENDDLIEKIATTILIKHCGLPNSIQNLLPTYDYLKDRRTGVIKPVSTMKAKNNYLPTSFSSPFWGVKVGTLSGTGKSTLKMYETNPPSLMDKLRGNWLDGKPVKEINTNEGDGTVLLSSSQLTGASENIVINQSHAGIIGTTEGVNKILDFLDSPPVEDPPFVEPKSALVLIGSNGNFWIKDSKGKTIQSDQGVISIINPKTEDFDFKYIPQNNNTLLIVAQFLPNGDVKYKEYKYRGYMPFSKRLHFNRENPREDICNDR